MKKGDVGEVDPHEEYLGIGAPVIDPRKIAVDMSMYTSTTYQGNDKIGHSHLLNIKKRLSGNTDTDAHEEYLGI